MARRPTKQNPQLVRLVVELRKASRAHAAPLWASVADRLERARHAVDPVNVSALDRLAAAGETVAVAGKVLADGAISKSLTVGAFSFSAAARAKIHAAGGSAVSLHALLQARPNAKGVRLLA